MGEEQGIKNRELGTRNKNENENENGNKKQ